MEKPKKKKKKRTQAYLDSLSAEEMMEMEEERYGKSSRWLNAVAKVFGVIALIVVLSIGGFFYKQYADLKKDLRAQLTESFREKACIHGLCIDGQWFSTIDTAYDYLMDYYFEFEFLGFSIRKYQYEWHKNGN